MDSKDAIQYISDHKSTIGDWRTCAQLYRDETGETISSDALRMRVYTHREKEGYESDPFLEFEKEKIQFRDERNARNAQVRNEARLDQKLDVIQKEFSKIQKIHFPRHSKKIKNQHTDKSVVILLSDWHIGLTYKNIFGEYDTDIAKERLGKLLDAVKAIQKQSGATEAHVIVLGDMISGNIHKTIQVTNRENVIEQIKTAGEMLTSFIYECIGMFGNVIVTSCPGNHSRMDRKEDALNDERLDDLITWVAEQILRQEKRVHFTKREDSTITAVQIRGKTYYCVHGDYDGYNEAAADRLMAMTGEKPEGIFYGHMHTPAYMEAHNMKMIRSGCLSGSGDEYTIRKRLDGRPCQTVIICGPEGIESFYPVYLDKERK